VFDIDQQHSMVSGCDAFLSKPIDVQKLFTLLKEHLRLQWVYEAGEEEAKSQIPAVDEAALVAPPAAEMAALHELAKLGDMRGIRKQAERIEKMDSRYKPFADKLREFARGFEDKALIAFVERYMEQGK
jgi:hypothetical protein